MISTISELDNVIASLTETFTDVELKAIKSELLKILIKHTIELNKQKGLGISINDVYFPSPMRFDFDEKSIAVIYDVKCVGLIHYTDIKSWS